MEEEPLTEEERKKAEEALFAFIINGIKNGESDETIAKNLVEKGFNEDILEIVKETRKNETEIAEKQQLTSGSILPVLIGGVIAAVVCGALWSWIAVSMDAEIGYMAVGVGFVTGYAVLIFAKGKRGVPLQVIASIASVLGILVGKYLIFMSLAKTYLAEQYGIEAVSQIPLVSGETIKIFIESFQDMVSGYDILWVILAIATAWYIPKGLGLKLPRTK